MAAIISLLVTITIALLITRIGGSALALTGLSEAVARFQARSAFTGVGFTTGESEKIVNHPVRRKILMMLMFWGNIGIAAVIASTIASFAAPPDNLDFMETVRYWTPRLGLLLAGLGLLWITFTSQYLDRAISRWVEYALLKWTKLDVRDYTSLLQLHNGYVVVEMQVQEGDWIAGKDLSQSNLSSEGVLVLGLTRESGKYVGSPNGQTIIQANDVLTLYGPADRIEEIDIRQEGFHGDRAHRIAVQVQEESLRVDDE